MEQDCCFLFHLKWEVWAAYFCIMNNALNMQYQSTDCINICTLSEQSWSVGPAPATLSTPGELAGKMEVLINNSNKVWDRRRLFGIFNCGTRIFIYDSDGDEDLCCCPFLNISLRMYIHEKGGIEKGFISAVHAVCDLLPCPTPFLFCVLHYLCLYFSFKSLLYLEGQKFP